MSEAGHAAPKSSPLGHGVLWYVIGLLVVVGLFLALVPVSECDKCHGEGAIHWGPPVCPVCAGHGKVPPL